MQAAIRRVWVLENMKKIGPGGFYHLAYAHHQTSPELLQELKRRSDHGQIHIFLLSDVGHALHIADGEVIAVHWFPEFLRIHFMIRSVYDMAVAPRSRWMSEYLLTL
ncbi:MAG: hypothetical protein GX162_13675 [Firmicutes bacterium]|jgi:hypothetical protein|nr:hypothetical protein [Bacillota bacterium]